MNYQDVTVGKRVKSIINPVPTYQVLEKKRGGWVLIMPLDDGFRDMRFNVRAKYLKIVSIFTKNA